LALPCRFVNAERVGFICREGLPVRVPAASPALAGAPEAAVPVPAVPAAAVPAAAVPAAASTGAKVWDVTAAVWSAAYQGSDFARARVRSGSWFSSAAESPWSESRSSRLV